MRRKFAKIALTTLTAATMILGISEASQVEGESKSAVAGISVSLSNYYDNTDDLKVDLVSNSLANVGTSNKSTVSSEDETDTTEETVEESTEEESTKAAKETTEESTKTTKSTEESATDSDTEEGSDDSEETDESTKASKETEESTKASKETGESTKASKETEESTKTSTDKSTKGSTTESSASTKKSTTSKTDSASKKATSSNSVYEDLIIAQTDSYINVRSSADAEDDNVIGRIYNECAATVLGESKDSDGELWYKISSGSIDVGYVKAEFFVTGDEAEELAEKVTSVKAVVTAKSLNVRAKANKNSEVIDGVYEGETYDVISEDGNGFVKIQVSGEVSGYVSKDYVDIEVSYPEAVTLEEEEARIEELNEIQAQIEDELETYVEYRDAGDYSSALEEAKYILGISQDMQEKAEYYHLGDFVSTAVDNIQNGEYAVKVMEVAMEYVDTTATQSVGTTTYQAQVEVPEQVAANNNATIETEQESLAAQQAAAATSSYDATAAAAPATSSYDAAAAQAAAEAQAAQQAAEAQAAQQAAEAAAAQAAAEETAAPVATSGNGSAVAGYATGWIGVCGYAYGGTNLTAGGGVDCSGFTQQVYAAFGVSLPHSSAAQAGAGVAVSADQLQPGDLVFYPGPAGGSSVGHVAIYIGNGQIVHAASPTYGICTINVDFKTILACRRILN